MSEYEESKTIPIWLDNCLFWRDVKVKVDYEEICRKIGLKVTKEN